jgi:UV DNA damage endonuclease
MPPKRKRSSVIAPEASTDGLAPGLHDNLVPPTASLSTTKAPTPKRRTSRRFEIDTNPDRNTEIIDGRTALRASPDSSENEQALEVGKIDGGTPKPAKRNDTRRTFPAEDSDSPLSYTPTEMPVSAPAQKRKKPPSSSSIAAKGGASETQALKRESPANKAAVSKAHEEDGDESVERQDPNGDEAVPSEDLDTMKKEAGRPPPVNTDYLPLPWKGRLGYVRTLCL